MPRVTTLRAAAPSRSSLCVRSRETSAREAVVGGQSSPGQAGLVCGGSGEDPRG